jgi:hypothetical protein
LIPFPRSHPFPGIREWESRGQCLRVNAGFTHSQDGWKWEIPFPFPCSQREWREWERQYADFIIESRSHFHVPKRPGAVVTMRKIGRFPIPIVYPYGRPFSGNGSRGWLAKTAKAAGGWERECPSLTRADHTARSSGDGGGTGPTGNPHPRHGWGDTARGNRAGKVNICACGRRVPPPPHVE